jgi:hypothetical protein
MEFFRTWITVLYLQPKPRAHMQAWKQLRLGSMTHTGVVCSATQSGRHILLS